MAALKSSWLCALLLVSCGDSAASGGGGAAGGAGGEVGGAGGAGGQGGEVSDVPLIAEAWATSCPGGDPPDNGVAPGADLHKVTLDEYPEALCNDGSPAIMYVRAASSEAMSGTWVIHLQPGGSCGSWEACRDRWCSYETSYDAAKMSSLYAPEVANGSGLFARSGANAFGDANQVYVYYCSSDFFTGQRSDAVLQDPEGAGPTYRLHFRGFDIIQAVHDALAGGVSSDDGVETLPPLSTAARVLLSGSSAGSNGQTHLLDWWAGQLPDAQVGGMLDAGTDPLVDAIADPDLALAYEEAIRTIHETVRVGLWNAWQDESCIAAHSGDDAHLCSLSAHVRLNHIVTPFFVRHDLRDPVQFNGLAPLGMSLAQYSDAMYSTMLRFASIRDDAEESADIAVTPGVYVTNCAQHIAMLNGPWFGVAAAGNASLEAPGGMDVTLHDALLGFSGGTPVQLVDTVDSTLSTCAATTSDQ